MEISKWKESDLFDFLVHNWDSSLTKSKLSLSYFDAYSEDRGAVVELKCRKKHYPDLMIEKAKYENMTRFADAYYICSTPEGVFCFLLSKDFDIEWEERWLPKYTDFGGSSSKTKTVGYLPIEIAEKLL